jgi:hypothetical protein
VFSNEEAKLLSRSRGNDHEVSASFESGVLNLDKQCSSCVTIVAQTGEQTMFFRKRKFHTIRRYEIYCSATILRGNIGLDVGEYIR